MRTFSLFLISFLTLTQAAFAESPDPTQQQIDAENQAADKFEVTVRDYYKAYLPKAESTGTSYSDCMKKCTDASSPMDCEAQCRGDFMAKASSERISGATDGPDCYEVGSGNLVPSRDGAGLVKKNCDGYGRQTYVNGSNSPSAGTRGIAYDDRGEALPDRGSYKSDGFKPQNDPRAPTAKK